MHIFDVLVFRDCNIFGLFVFGPLLCHYLVFFLSGPNQLLVIVLLMRFLFLFLCLVVLNYFLLKILRTFAALRHLVSFLNHSAEILLELILNNFL